MSIEKLANMEPAVRKALETFVQKGVETAKAIPELMRLAFDQVAEAGTAFIAGGESLAKIAGTALEDPAIASALESIRRDGDRLIHKAKTATVACFSSLSMLQAPPVPGEVLPATPETTVVAPGPEVGTPEAPEHLKVPDVTSWLGPLLEGRTAESSSGRETWIYRLRDPGNRSPALEAVRRMRSEMSTTAKKLAEDIAKSLSPEESQLATYLGSELKPKEAAEFLGGISVEGPATALMKKMKEQGTPLISQFERIEESQGDALEPLLALQESGMKLQNIAGAEGLTSEAAQKALAEYLAAAQSLGVNIEYTVKE